MSREPFMAGLAGAFSLCLLACGGHNPPPAGGPPAPGSTTAAISAADLEIRLYILADDSMQGRRSGTEGNLKGTNYIAAEAARIGLRPAGEDGGWFQTVPLVIRELPGESSIVVDGIAYSPESDFLVRDQGQGARPVDGAQVIFGGVVGDSTQAVITPDQAAGKLVVVAVAPGANGQAQGTVNRAVTTSRFPTAAGIAVATLDNIDAAEQAELREGSARLAAADSQPIPTFMYVTSRFATTLLSESTGEAKAGDPGKIVHGKVRFSDTPPPFPARNVVGILLGADPRLRNEIVAIGAHNDHIGIAPVPEDHDSIRAFNRVMRPEGANSTAGKPTAEQHRQIRAILDSLRKIRPPRMDSIYNGADDDGSG
ncbi:MAG: hypothetical protein ACREL3_13515, partial [Gemmatimonadales bacterium]